MSQRQQPHAVGTFPLCPDCGDELRHIVDDRASAGGHFLSCCCGDSPKFGSLPLLWAAMLGWCERRGVAAPCLQPPRAGQREPQRARA
jgi:hypothetical protein